MPTYNSSVPWDYNNISWKSHLITREYISNELLVSFHRLPWSCTKRRTKYTEVTTDGDNPPGHNPHFPMNSQTLPWNICNNKIHFQNFLNHSHPSNQNINFTRNSQTIFTNRIKFSSITGFNEFPQTNKNEASTRDINWINLSTTRREESRKPT